MKSILLSLGYLWLRSLRVRWLSSDPIPQQAILLLWHEHLPIGIRVFAHLRINVLISKSRDGTWAAKACQLFGYNVHRGSTSQGGASGMRALARALEHSRPLAGRTLAGRTLAGMALDGPRGPRRQIQPGSHWLSKFSGMPVIPVSIQATASFRLNSWDRCLIPWPFSVVTVRLGQPFHPTDSGQIKAAMDAVEYPISSQDIYIHAPQPV